MIRFFEYSGAHCLPGKFLAPSGNCVFMAFRDFNVGIGLDGQEGI